MPSKSLKAVPVPKPDLTPRRMIERAVALRPVLRARQAECEAMGRIPDETNREFVEAGFYRILQPRRRREHGPVALASPRPATASTS